MVSDLVTEFKEDAITLASASKGDLDDALNVINNNEDEIAEKYARFTFRRFDFLMWTHMKLSTSIFARENPLSRMCLADLGLTCMERAMVFSCALVGSMAMSALFYRVDLGDADDGTLRTRLIKNF